jgi:hypothetical protein
MLRKGLLTLSLVALIGAAGCSGVRQTSTDFAAHGECFRILGFAIPADDMQMARDKVPAGANVVTVASTAADWTSFWGFFGNLFGFHWTSISGTK